MSDEREIESGELAQLEGGPDPVERLEARRHAHAALFGDSLVSGTAPLRVDRYRLISRAGSGGLGTVWKAYDPKLDRELAIKLLRRDRLGVGRARQQLLAEATLMAQLAHPNVVRVYDIGEAPVAVGNAVSEADPQLYVAMEFVDGQTLRQWQRERPRSVAELLAVYSQAAAGLLAAHEAQLVHGDFKPDNVLIDSRGRVLVTDFAVTRNIVRERVEHELSTLESPTESERNHRVRESIAAVMIGTPAYMAPEQLDGEVPDARSDQFGFCVALWEALTGERPFFGRTFLALREAIAAGPPAFPASVRPARLRSVLARGLAEDPRQRYPDLQALLSDLDKLEDSPPRRRVAIVGTSLLAGIGALIVVPQLLAVEPSPTAEVASPACVDEAQLRLAEVWSDERRAALGKPVQQRLEPWHADWLVASQAACADREATAVQHLCLDRQLQRVAALTSVLSTVDTPALVHVDAALAGLPSVAACSDPSLAARLTTEPSLADPAQRQAFVDARESLDRAEVLVALHELDEALSLLDPVLGLSESLGWEAGRARALVLRGSARSALGQAQAGEDDLFEATVAARRADRPDLEAAALLELAAQAVATGDPQDARRWIELAATAVEAAGDPRQLAELARVRELVPR